MYREVPPGVARFTGSFYDVVTIKYFCPLCKKS